MIILYKLIMLTFFFLFVKVFIKRFKNISVTALRFACFSVHCVFFSYILKILSHLFSSCVYIYAISLRNYYFVSGRSKLL